MGNVTQFEEAEKEHVPEIYQMITQHAMKKGEHICFNYGRCNNRYWTINYGLGIIDNEYDAIPVHVKLGEDEKVVLLHRATSIDGLLALCKQQLEKEGKLNPSEKDILERALHLVDETMKDLFGQDSITQ